MSQQLVEYAKGRFVTPSRIVEASIYLKDNPKMAEPGQPQKIIRVALRLDVKESTKDVVYSDPFASEQDAAKYIQNLPID